MRRKEKLTVRHGIRELFWKEFMSPDLKKKSESAQLVFMALGFRVSWTWTWTWTFTGKSRLPVTVNRDAKAARGDCQSYGHMTLSQRSISNSVFQLELQVQVQVQVERSALGYLVLHTQIPTALFYTQSSQAGVSSEYPPWHSYSSESRQPTSLFASSTTIPKGISGV